jgi:DNA replication protein DnaC
MLAHPTIEQLHAMGLKGMAKALVELSDNEDARTLSHAEWLGLLLEREATLRHDRRLAARLRFAKLRFQARPEDVDWHIPRALDRPLFTALMKCKWVDAAEPVLITGKTGLGKSWLACALGFAACRANHTVLYYRAEKLFADLALARVDGRYPRLIRLLCSVKLLIIDDFGLAPLDAQGRKDMLELVEERYGRTGLVVTSQLAVDKWHVMVGDPTYADAILDRIAHNSHRVTLEGDSIRKTKGRQSKSGNGGGTAAGARDS